MATKKRSSPTGTPQRSPGTIASEGGVRLQTMAVGSLPLVQAVCERMRFEEYLDAYLPKPSQKPKVPYAKGVALLVRNILLSREPVYGVGDWAEEFAPDLLGLLPSHVAALNDDRVGRCLDHLFRSDFPSLVLAVTQHVVKEFEVDLDELHNDSTTITFHGKYEDAVAGASILGKPTRAITWGHNKDHRPDLKQMLFILTASRDGGVPLYFTAADGNLTDDQTHRDTWDLLREIAGRADFLYVADSKLATKENMTHIAAAGGRFVTVLPRSRGEDKQFRERVRRGSVTWKRVLRREDTKGVVTDDVSTCAAQCLSSEGFPIHWLLSTRKRRQDQETRERHIQRALRAIGELHERLLLPRTRYRSLDKVEKALEVALRDLPGARWLKVEIFTVHEDLYEQERQGRPGPKTRYRRKVRSRFELEVERRHDDLEQEAATDGIFPLITNDSALSAREAFAAYKRQPDLEKRFSQLKSDLEIAPVYLHNAGRIEALLCVFYFALLIQTLLEREVRHKMKQKKIPSLPLYHENRASKSPTARRILDAFGGVFRHHLRQPGERKTLELITELNPLQCTVLELLDLDPEQYGRSPRRAGG